MWNKVRELVGDESLSEIVATALQQVIITMECATAGFKDIEIEVGEWNAGHLVKFQGHELARARDSHQIAYLTPKGKILIYLDHDMNPESCWAEYHVFDNLVEASGQGNAGQEGV